MRTYESATMPPSNDSQEARGRFLATWRPCPRMELGPRLCVPPFRAVCSFRERFFYRSVRCAGPHSSIAIRQPPSHSMEIAYERHVARRAVVEDDVGDSVALRADVP